MIRIVLFLFLLSGCAPHKRPSPIPPTLPDLAAYDEIQTRLGDFLDLGFVVSKDETGAAQSQGDALIFSGLALYGLDCNHGAPIADAIENMVYSTGGTLYRHPDLPNNVSMDGALGLYRGLLKRVQDCGEGARWSGIFKAHFAYMANNGGKINAGDNATFAPGFDYLPRRLASYFNLAAAPSASDKSLLESEISSWTSGVLATKSACYRIHLGLLSFQILDALGDPASESGRGIFCAATTSAGLETTDHWCGRNGLGDFLANFKYNVWEYAPQRCKSWETPDGNGLERPAIDYLVGWSDYHGSQK